MATSPNSRPCRSAPLHLRLFAPLVPLLLLLPACGGSDPPPELPALVSAEATRIVNDGRAFDASIIRVTFDRDIAPLTGGVPFASNIELLVPFPDFEAGVEAEARVFVQDAIVVETNPRLVDLTVLRAIPQGATLVVSGRAFIRGSEERLTIPVESDISPVAAFLATTPFATTNPALFAPGLVAEVTEADRDPAAMRAALQEFLTSRGAGEQVLTRALSYFDAIPPELVPSPKLRAAIAGLTGTFAEPAVPYLMTSQNCTGLPVARITFEEPPDFPDLLARVTFDEDGARVISVHPDLEGERIEHLMSVMAHEPIHCDRSGGKFEEVAATALDTFLYIHLLAADPTLARAGTRLARELNIDVIAAINSGARFPESFGILPATTLPLALPGTTSTVDSFAELVAAGYPSITFNSSPPEDLAQTYVGLLAEAVGMPPGDAFDLAYLDELLGRATSLQTILAAISALELVPFE